MTLPILLVHGSFHTGECWKRLVPELAGRGFKVGTMTLSGHRGNAKWPWLVSMEAYGTDVITAAEALGGKCVLVGHSMAGTVISGAAERRPDLFAGMVYLSAFVPRFGKCSQLKLEPSSAALRAGAKPSLLHGIVTMPPDAARRVFYNRCETVVQERAIELLSPQPMRPPLGSVTTTEARLGSIPKHYIQCLDDEALPLTSQRAMQAHMPFASVQSIDSDHSPFFCKPAELADLIERSAAPRTG